jgi:integrase
MREPPWHRTGLGNRSCSSRRVLKRDRGTARHARARSFENALAFAWTDNRGAGAARTAPPRGTDKETSKMPNKHRRPPGIRPRHSRSCRARDWESCSCKPSYEASIWLRLDGKKHRRVFPSLAAAKGWQADSTHAAAKGALRAPTRITVRQAADAWLDGAASGRITTRGGDVFKPSTVRSYNDSLRKHILPELGARRLSEVRRADVQALVERMNGKGLSPSSTRNAINAFRVICRRALLQQELALDPCAGIALPSVRSRRTPSVSAEEVARRITTVHENDRALWACAFYCGPRLGELRALRWEDIDLDGAVLRIERGWDRVAGPIEPKSRAGRRTIPLPDEVRMHLIRHRLKTGRVAGLVFGGTADVPFDPTSATTRARHIWERAGMTAVTFHVARHVCASLWIDAGIPLTSVSKFLGHSSITITHDTYAHLVRGAEERAASAFDDYLRRAAK